MNLDFIKFLANCDIEYENYERLTEDEKQELTNKFNSEQKIEKNKKSQEKFKTAGRSKQGCGCNIISIPILLFLLFFIYIVITSIFR